MSETSTCYKQHIDLGNMWWQGSRGAGCRSATLIKAKTKVSQNDLACVRLSQAVRTCHRRQSRATMRHVKPKTPDEIPSVGKGKKKKNLKQQTAALRRKLKTNQSQSVAVSHLCVAPSEGDTWRGNRGTSSSHAGFLQFTSGADGS